MDMSVEKTIAAAAEKLNYEMNAKQAMCGQAMQQGIGGLGEYRRPSLREESEKHADLHRKEADKRERAAAFFRDNPAFDEFIQLIRSGVISI